MIKQERRLGRGLEALLGRPDDEQDAAAPHAPATGIHAGGVPSAEAGAKIPVSLIDPNPFQPRRTFDDAELAHLAKSIQEHGLIQPIVVRQVAGRYQLIAGERRWRAAQTIGWTTIAARLVEADDRQVAEVAIVENLQRQDLNPLEKAAAFQQYLEKYRCSQEELAKRIGIDRSTISNLIRLLELPNKVQDALRNGQISAGHARALLPLGEEKEQVAFARRIHAEGLSVRAIEQLVKEQNSKEDGQPAAAAPKSEPAGPPKSDHLASLEQQFRMTLGTKVDIKEGPNHSGRIVIHFASNDEFERLRRQVLALIAAPIDSAPAFPPPHFDPGMTLEHGQHEGRPHPDQQQQHFEHQHDQHQHAGEHQQHHG